MMDLRVHTERLDLAPLTLDEVREADAIWLVSSVRQAAPVTELDGRAYPVDAALTAELNAYLLARTE